MSPILSCFKTVGAKEVVPTPNAPVVLKVNLVVIVVEPKAPDVAKYILPDCSPSIWKTGYPAL